MLRSRTVHLAALVVLAAGLFAGSAYAQSADADTLNKRVEALEKRIATLEQTLAQKLSAIEQKLSKIGSETGAPGAPAAPNPLEDEARAEFMKINNLVQQAKLEEAKTEMASFMKKYGSTRTAAQARRLDEELSVVGKAAPTSWSGVEKWYQGEKQVNLAGGKTTLLVFWELWCPHCKREVPKLQQAYTDLSGSGLQVVGLTKMSRNTTDDALREFLTQEKVGYPVAKEDGSLSQYFNVSGVPAAAVIKGGKVIWRGHPAQLSDAILKGWL